MNKWKGSLGMKVAAWICLTLCGILLLGSAVGAVMLWDNDFYRSTEKELREQAFSSIANRYSYMALYFLKEEREYDWNETNFRYGIIQAENIDEIDLNDPGSYVERNFTEEVREQDLYMIYQVMTENTVVYYSESLFGGYGIGGRASDSGSVSMPILHICYNKQDGIFYYETVDGFYPVNHVTLERETADGTGIYSFVYDSAQGMYHNTGTSGNPETEVIASEEPVSSLGSAEVSSGDINDDSTYIVDDLTGKTADEILKMEYLTFDMLDSTGWSIETWEMVQLDDTRYLNDGNIVWWINDLYMERQPVMRGENYYAGGDYLYVVHDVERVPYWVVSILPENVGTDWNGDLFEQANTLLTLGWTMRYLVYVIMVCSFAAGVALFVFLMSGAGHQKDREEIVATWLDRVPFDIYLAIAFFAAVILFLIARDASYSLGSLMEIIVYGVYALCIGWLVLATFLTFAVRVKLGQWWRNTLLWRVYDVVKRAAILIYRNLPLFGKAFLLMGGLAFLEFIGMFITWDSRSFGALFVMWLFEKVLLTGIVFVAVFQMKKLREGGNKLAEGDLAHRVDTKNMFWEFKKHGESLNNISIGMSRAVDARMKSERFKTELITNVSHDIKTPLTSIINYVDLLGREELENENALEYVEVLKRQSARLKKLIEDLMEASKASTGNLGVNMEQLEVGVSMVQTVGEFEEKLQANELELLIRRPEESVYILADSRHLWRVIDNLMNNICKYAQPHTRVYINLERQGDRAVLTFRNTSKYPLNITSEELMERFVRGDSSRNTEGSGLGLSIARSLMELMGGSFELYVDGDLFKVVLGMPII